MSRNIQLICLILLAAALAACAVVQPGPTSITHLPNPASVFCEENGGILEIRQDTDGNQTGVCMFDDGKECDEWAFYRGECGPEKVTPTTSEAASEPATAEPAQAPESTQVAETTQAAEPTAELTSDGWKIYRHATLGYSFAYPPDASIVEDDNPLDSFSILGPEVNGERWPFITISHPGDREEYRPPEGADLEQWLVDHYLVGENRQPDLTIAGVPAIHYRHERSPQSYADDRYYFAYQGQLYMILIGHSGDKEDWELYNQFLESFQFDQQ